jgi:hypothetical protein
LVDQLVGDVQIVGQLVLNHLTPRVVRRGWTRGWRRRDDEIDFTLIAPLNTGGITVGLQFREDRVNLEEKFPLQLPLFRAPFLARVLKHALANISEYSLKSRLKLHATACD